MPADRVAFAREMCQFTGALRGIVLESQAVMMAEMRLANSALRDEMMHELHRAREAATTRPQPERPPTLSVGPSPSLPGWGMIVKGGNAGGGSGSPSGNSGGDGKHSKLGTSAPPAGAPQTARSDFDPFPPLFEICVDGGKFV